jgi:SNF2 family DNA or RNA helicase
VLEDNFYLVHLKTLIDSSTKIQRLEKILASMSKKSKDWIAKGERKEKMSIKKRIDIINRFCGREDSPYYASVFEADILLSTTPCVGTGLNLVAASHVVLFDLLWMRKD